MDFTPFPKIPRLNRDVVVTEKIDGTNAQVWIGDIDPENEATIPYQNMHGTCWLDDADILDTWMINNRRLIMRAGSRKRWIMSGKDNYGFALWVSMNSVKLRALGEGHHFGEWYGKGIQRGYGLDHKRFALFNTHRWSDKKGDRPACCHVVAVLERTTWDKLNVAWIISDLQRTGSYAVPGFNNPEGIVLFHAASGQLFKVTCEGDSYPKSAHTTYKETN